MIITAIMALLLIVGCGQDNTFLGTWINSNDVEIEIVSMDPCEVHFEMEDGTISRFYEFDSRVSDDGSFDWALVENNMGGIFGLRFPRNSYSTIELSIFDSDGNIALSDMFYRP